MLVCFCVQSFLHTEIVCMELILNNLSNNEAECFVIYVTRCRVFMSLEMKEPLQGEIFTGIGLQWLLN